MPKYLDGAGLSRFWNNIKRSIGSASQEQVDAWLDNHPEATTTVQDGSITLIKLADDSVALVSGLKGLADYATADMVKKIQPNAVVNGWKIASDGSAVADANYALHKFRLNAGSLIRIACTDSSAVIRFTSNGAVTVDPSQAGIIQVLDTGYNGTAVAPDNTTYLIVSALRSATVSVYRDALKLLVDSLIAADARVNAYMNMEAPIIECEFESGTINDGNGTGWTLPNAKRLRTDRYIHSSSGIINIDNPDGLRWFVIEYDYNQNMVGKAATWISGNSYVMQHGSLAKIILSRIDNADMTTSDAENLIVLDGFGLPLISLSDKMTPFASSDGWSIATNGVGILDADYRLDKYAVTEGDTLYLISRSVAQFQSDATVGAGTNPYIVGSPIVGGTQTTVTVPEGATYLIVSVDKSYSGMPIGAYSLANTSKGTHANHTMAISPTLAGERFIGHRGGGKTAPENTIPSLEQGHENGFRIFEVDLKFTSDDVPVLLHDQTINRTARNDDGTELSSTVNIGDITYEQASAYDYGIWKGQQYAGTELPTLKDALMWAKANGCCIEIDMYDTPNLNATKAAGIVSLVRRCGMVGSTLFTALYSTLGYFAQYDDICVCCSTPTLTEQGISATEDLLGRSQYTIASVQYPYVTAEQVAIVHSHGIAAKGFTATSAQTARHLFELGADKVILDGVYPSEV